MNELEQLRQRVESLENFINQMKNSASIPVEIDQAFRDRFSKGGLQGVTTGNSSSTNIALSGDPQNITVPAQPAGSLRVSFNGVNYDLLYK